MKLVTIVGTRPQFIKAAAISHAINSSAYNIEEIIIHSGQHYDQKMSDIFFDQLRITKPKYNLGIGSGSHGFQTGHALIGIEDILISEEPDAVLVYGDCNSTLSGALAASKLHIPLLHVEAGLRSFNRKMPEEINRIVTDVISDILFCPAQLASDHLDVENILGKVEVVGDVMFDCIRLFKGISNETSSILRKLQLTQRQYSLVTIHRAENTNDRERLSQIIIALQKLASNHKLVVPLHPRTIAQFKKFNLTIEHENIYITDPLSYLDMLSLTSNAKAVLTDSGGVQKEAFFHQVPCITMRDETEWTETVSSGWNKIVGADAKKIEAAFQEFDQITPTPDTTYPYGNGYAAERIVEIIYQEYNCQNGI